MVDAGIASVDLPRGSLLRTALRSPSFVAGAVITLIFIGLALVSFVWTPFNFATQDIPNKLHAPPPSTGSAPTSMAATSFRRSSWAPAPRSPSPSSP